MEWKSPEAFEPNQRKPLQGYAIEKSFGHTGKPIEGIYLRQVTFSESLYLNHLCRFLIHVADPPLHGFTNSVRF